MTQTPKKQPEEKLDSTENGSESLAPIKILLVDDQSLVRMGFRMMIEAQDYAEDVAPLEVVGEAADGQAAVKMARALRPDVVLMDVRMPNQDGIAATRDIVTENPQVKVLILTTFDLDEYAFSGLRAGASGFLLKDSLPEDLIRSIRSVAGGDAVMSPRVTRRMLEMFGSELPTANEAEEEYEEASPNEMLADLTSREMEVLKLIAQGLSNQEIADKLFLSTTTIKTHVGNVLMKLGVRDRVQAVIFAYESGLIEPKEGN